MKPFTISIQNERTSEHLKLPELAWIFPEKACAQDFEVKNKFQAVSRLFPGYFPAARWLMRFQINSPFSKNLRGILKIPNSKYEVHQVCSKYLRSNNFKYLALKEEVVWLAEIYANGNGNNA
jgi:hypothetical protein